MSVSPLETIRIESATRWDAVDLAQRLHGLHTYLVQLGDRRWHVCVKPEGEVEAVFPAVLQTAERWAAERRLAAVVHARGRSYELRGTSSHRAE